MDCSRTVTSAPSGESHLVTWIWILTATLGRLSSVAPLGVCPSPSQVIVDKWRSRSRLCQGKRMQTYAKKALNILVFCLLSVSALSHPFVSRPTVSPNCFFLQETLHVSLCPQPGLAPAGLWPSDFIPGWINNACMLLFLLLSHASTCCKLLFCISFCWEDTCLVSTSTLLVFLHEWIVYSWALIFTHTPCSMPWLLLGNFPHLQLGLAASLNPTSFLRATGLDLRI